MAAVQRSAARATAPLLPDLLLAMVGHSGDVFEACEGGGVRLTPWVDWVEDSDREQLETLASLGEAFSELESFSAAAQDSESRSWLAAALGAGVEELLAAYCEDVEEVDARLEEGLCPSATAILDHLSEYRELLPSAARLIAVATGWDGARQRGGEDIGGALATPDRPVPLSSPPTQGPAPSASPEAEKPTGTFCTAPLWASLETSCTCGDPTMADVATRLHYHARQALWRLIEAWVAYGTLDDEGGEFFIHGVSAGPEGGRAGSAGVLSDRAWSRDAWEWHSGFAVVPARLPGAVGSEAAEAILFAGKVARVLGQGRGLGDGYRPGSGRGAGEGPLETGGPGDGSGALPAPGAPGLAAIPPFALAGASPPSHLSSTLEALRLALTDEGVPSAASVRRAALGLRSAAARALAGAVARDADLALRLRALSGALLMRDGDLWGGWLELCSGMFGATPDPAASVIDASRRLVAAAASCNGAAAAGAGPHADPSLAEVALEWRGREGRAAPGAASTEPRDGAEGEPPAPRLRGLVAPPLDAWDGLALTARPSWPLHLFVSPQGGEVYVTAWQTLFRLARVERSLRQAWTATRRSGRPAAASAAARARSGEVPGRGERGDAGAGEAAARCPEGRPGPDPADPASAGDYPWDLGRRAAARAKAEAIADDASVARAAAALRARMAHVVSAFSAHLQEDVAEGCWGELRESLRGARDFSDAQAAHDAYLSALSRRALLDEPPFQRVLGFLLQLCSRFATRVVEAAGAAGIEGAPSTPARDGLRPRGSPRGPPGASRLSLPELDSFVREFRLQHALLFRLLAGDRPRGADRAASVRRLLLRLDWNGDGVRDAVLWRVG